MTVEQQLINAVEKYKPILRLQNWQIIIAFTTTVSYPRVHITWRYKQATIDWPIENGFHEQLLLHELIHIVVTDLDAAITRLELDGKYAKATVEDGLERTVEDFTKIIFSLVNEKK